MTKKIKYLLMLLMLLPAVKVWAQLGGQPSSLPASGVKKPTTAKKHIIHKPIMPDTAKTYVRDNRFNFFENFPDNRNNWVGVGISDSVETTINNYKLQIKNNAGDGRIIYKNFNINVNQDFDVSVTTQWADGVSDNNFGLIYCSNASAGAFFLFGISDDGSYDIGYVQNEPAWHYLRAWTQSDYINKANIPNILSIKKVGSYINFYINDHLVETFPFDGGYGNDFGFGVIQKQTIDFSNYYLNGSIKN